MLKIGNWNVEWAAKRSQRTKYIQSILRSLDADILCVTEGFSFHLPDEQHVLKSKPSGTSMDAKDGHKVMLWSKNHWSDVDTFGSSDLPEGRFVSGITETPVGEVRVIGVVIPYAHYRTGETWDEKRQKHNEGKERYLRALHNITVEKQHTDKTIIVGDFNLTIPPADKPRLNSIDKLFKQAFTNWYIPTGQPNIPMFSSTQKQTLASDKHIIDHLAHTPDLETTSVWRWHRFHEDGTRLSDHNGIFVSLTTRGE
jgi:exonuclease III